MEKSGAMIQENVRISRVMEFLFAPWRAGAQHAAPLRRPEKSSEINLLLQEENENGAGCEKGGGKAEGDAYAEGGPEGADD